MRGGGWRGVKQTGEWGGRGDRPRERESEGAGGGVEGGEADGGVGREGRLTKRERESVRGRGGGRDGGGGEADGGVGREGRLTKRERESEGAGGGGARCPRQLTNKLRKTRQESDVAQPTKSGHR